MFDRNEIKIEKLILEALERIMADLTKLTADVTAQTGLITALTTKVTTQTAEITDLKNQLAAALASANDQAAVDAIDATVETNNAAITAVTA